MKTVELEKNYSPLQVENKWYEKWEKDGKFSATAREGKDHFCIVIPPPNITGSLHMGHALNNTLQDSLIRYNRMRGKESLWIPGTDHAGIATQRVVEKELKKEGTDRWKIGREEFLKRVWRWKEEYGGKIINQLKRMGCSCDWERERFTLDGGCSRAVREAFVQLYEKGWIYRGKRIINWCCHCLTALSDLEVEHREKDGKLYYLRYKAADGGPGIVIATTRPETILADTAVAVNPKDPRYKDLVGKQVVLPLVGRLLPVIADDYVDIEFGTGALKITPAHDANDYNVGQRHGLESIQVIDEKGRMSGDESGRYKGMERFECRKAIVEDLQQGGYLEKIEDYHMAVGVCYRCDTVIEPYLSEQWFLKASEMAKPAIEAVKSGRTKFHPERFSRIYLNWMENLLDWCISRQLWWGHRIPIWTCSECGFEGAFKEDPDKCPKCGHQLMQDENVLDTWFSSGLWPFSTMGWPEKTKDLGFFYPTSVLITDRGIIFLWVARMMMFGYEFMGDAPFDDVIIHATILNREGVRMSKSLGTGIDPLELCDKYGTDATRLGLAFMTEQGQDIRFAEERIEMGRNFANKIWNASRYIFNFMDGSVSVKDTNPEDSDFEIWDRWILSRLHSTIGQVTQAIESYQFDDAAKGLYSFFWDNFCDWYIEITKPILYGDDEKAKNRTLWVLINVLHNFLRLAHPIIPFITEEIWSYLSRFCGDEGMIITASWPLPDENRILAPVEEEFALMAEAVKGFRNMRAEAGLTPKQQGVFIIETESEKELNLLLETKEIIMHLSQASSLEIALKTDMVHRQSLSVRSGSMDLYMPLKGLVDLDREIQRLQKEMDKLDKNLQALEKKCTNPGFLQKASPDVVEKERARLAEGLEQKARLIERMDLLKD